MHPESPLSDATDRVIAAIEAKTGRSRRRNGREWRLVCPAHDDTDPSLDVREGADGAPIMQCRSAGCKTDAILKSVGLSWIDVYGTSENWTPHGPASAFYTYHDAGGQLLFQVARTPGKEFPCRRPNSDSASGWRWNMKDVERVLYHLPEVLAAAAAGETVFVVEGEKDADRLRKLGLVATCNPGGAGKWRPEYALSLRGARVVVIADRDPNKQGAQHARKVAASLHGIALSVLVMQADPSIEKKGADVSDHLDAGFTMEQLVPLELEAVDADEPRLEEEPPPAGAEEGAEPVEGPRLRFLVGTEFVEQELARIDPLIGVEGDAILMPGSLAILAGIGGAGKTTLALHALAHWAEGLTWFGMPAARPLRIVVIENEGPHDPFVNKVKEFSRRFHDCPCCGEPHGGGGAFLDNCLFLDAPWGHFTWESDELAKQLRSAALDFGADLVVANPLGRLGMKGAGTPEETRAFLDLLFRGGLGEDFAALLLHHMAKPQGRGAHLTQQVSGDWGPHPDTIMTLEPDGEKKGKLTFAKVRWGDEQGRVLLLDWLTDKDGPVGYRVKDAPTGIPDEDVYERIDEFLEAQDGPVGLTAIRKSVKGNAKRVSELVKQGASEGRYVAAGNGKRLQYQLADRDQPEPEQTSFIDHDRGVI